MNRRLFILTAILASFAASARAEDAGSSGSDTSGQKGGGSGDGGDGGDGHDVGADGNGGEAGDGTRSGSAGGGESNSGGSSGTNAALSRADILPLSRMLEIFRGYGQLTVVDVRLVERKQTLVYAFKFIDTQGSVRRAYFDAHTGAVAG